MVLDPVITLGNLLTILAMLAAIVGVAVALNVRVVKVEAKLPTIDNRMNSLEQADETIRQEVRAVRAEVGTQFKVLQSDMRAANQHLQNRLDSIFMQLGNRITPPQ